MIASISHDEIEQKIFRSLEQLRDRDPYLLQNDLNECSINHKLACYLQRNFPEWDVDCEYNKDSDTVKELDLPKNKVDWNDTEAKSVFPDIIIHKRGRKDLNLLVIEVKKSTNKSGRKHDFNKLSAYGYELDYFCTLFLEIGTREKWGTWVLNWKKQNNFNA